MEICVIVLHSAMQSSLAMKKIIVAKAAKN